MHILAAVVANVSDEEMQEHYDNFFEDVFVECEDKYGEIEEMNVCDNLGDHLVGNVYIKVQIGKYTFSTMFLTMICVSFVAKKTLKELWTIWTIGGLVEGLFMPS